ncbi:MAG: photosystem II biogenesis protein Psp29 [Oscillatoriales cyanobacterium]|nr:MAG: photosystem II biogenesis protein Psp29 [Oscillatoriales cyanobacterium]
MNEIRTVSETKRTFYSLHQRPINAIYRRVVEELMVEMHLLSVSADFRFEPIYVLGVVTAFDRFMTGYQPERDLGSIFHALCQSVGGNVDDYRYRASNLLDAAKATGFEGMKAALNREDGSGGPLREAADVIFAESSFKYSRLFGIGLYTLLEATVLDLAENADRLKEAIESFAATLNLPIDKLQKDLELYRGNLEKIAQARITYEDMLEAERRKREQRAAEKSAAAEAKAAAEAGAATEAEVNAAPSDPA